MESCLESVPDGSAMNPANLFKSDCTLYPSFRVHEADAANPKVS